MKMVGNLLFRKTLQTLKKERQGKIPWDEEVDSNHKQEWIKYFEMLLQLSNIKISRSFKHENCDENIRPDLIMFQDGSKDAFGAAAYILWSLKDGSKQCSLIMSKAKLGPLLDEADTVRSELSGATYGSRLKT